MAQKNKQELKEASNVIRQETQEGANTKGRVANILDDMIDSLLGVADLDNVDNTSDLDKPISTATQEALDGKYDASNPLGFITAVSKEDVGLGNVDNTSDLNKPISTATQAALSSKADLSSISSFETTAQLNVRDAANRNLQNATGFLEVTKISNFQDNVSANSNVTANTAKRSYPQSDQDKLSTVQSGAQVNRTPVQTVQDIESLGGTDNAFDITKAKNLERANEDQFERVEGIFQIKTNEEPTENSEAFVNSGSIFNLMEKIQKNFSSSILGHELSFSPGRYPSDVNIQMVIPVENGFLITGSWTNRIAYSCDGVNFIELTGTSFSVSPVSFNKIMNKIMVVGTNSFNNTGHAILSLDGGLNWTELTTIADKNLMDVTSIGKRWLACANSGTGSRVVYSDDDGTTWQESTFLEELNFRCITAGNGVLILVSQDGTQRMYRSTDNGVTFESVGLGTIGGQSWNRGIFFKNKFIIGSAGGSSGKYLVSEDLGLTFTQVSNGYNSAENGIRSFAIIGDFLFSTTNSGLIFRTTNGVDWELIDNPLVGRNITAIGGNFINGYPVVVIAASSGTNNRIQTTLKMD